jgi:hypothetical protein
MAQKGAHKTKRQNGTGNSITLFFDLSDASERRALEASKLLASKHGRRKAALVAMLDAIYRVYESSGELLSPAEIGAALMGQPPPPNRAPVGFAAAQSSQIVASDVTAEARRAARQPADSSPGVEIVAGGKADAQTVADNFLRANARAFFD